MLCISAREPPEVVVQYGFINNVVPKLLAEQVDPNGHGYEAEHRTEDQEKPYSEREFSPYQEPDSQGR